MKNLRLIPVLAMLFMLNVASMCSSNDDNSNPTVQDPTPIINTAAQGTWRVTLYEDSGVNETSNFSGFNFTFNSNNVLNVTGNGLTLNGTWSVTSDNSGDDSPSPDLDFNIGFVSPAPTKFIELTDDWNIITYTSTKIQLIHVSGGNGGTDYITFEKN
jgi:hypothetical protein